MTQRYKVIEERDDNGEGWYEIWFEHKFLWTTKWYSVKDRKFRYEFTRQFKTLEDVDRYFKEQRVTRRVVLEGLVE